MTGVTLHLLEQDQVPPDIVLHKEKEQKTSGDKKHLICRICGEIITSEQNRVSIHGSHIHTRQNPANILFTFSCFDAAPGCRVCGPATREHTWFAGHYWQFAVCSGCGEHLGWSFKNSNRFYGLIVERLINSDERTG